MTIEEKNKRIKEAVEDLYDSDFVKLYNEYAEVNGYDRAYTTGEAEMLYPIEEGADIEKVFRQWSSVLTDAGNPKYDFIIDSVYGWEKFKRKTYEGEVIKCVQRDGILYRNLPEVIQMIIDEYEDEREE